MWDVRYRPLKFTDVLGQEGSAQVLKSRLRNKTGLDTSYIFSGGHGQGKTTLARILARALLCLNLKDEEPCNECDNCRDILNETSPGFTEMDSASRGTIDVARGIVDDLPFVVQGVSKRIYLFDESHRMSRDAQDVLLKPIEDKRLVGIFCTTEPEKIRGPIRSRCEEYAIRKVTREDILKRMKWVLEQEGVPYQDDAVLTVIDYSHGHVRDILNRLEMVGQLGEVTLEAVREHLKLSVVATYYDILLALGDPVTSVRLIEAACDQVDPEDVSTGIAEAAMNSFRLANNMFADFSIVDRERAQKVWDMYGPDVVSLAEYFLRDYKPSKISLVCNTVRCAKGVPQRVAAPTNSPPVVVQATTVVDTATFTPQTPVQHPPVPVETAASSPSPQAPPVAAVSSSAPVQQAPAAAVSKLAPLTDYDDKATPATMPRGAAVSKTTTLNLKGAGDRDYLTPEEWKREFEAIHLHHTRV